MKLTDDPDKAFLLNGVITRFSIVNSDSNVVPAEVANHPLASPGSEYYGMVKQQVLSEIGEGNYVICDNKPDLLSPLGAVPKPTGDIRLIHDCSCPVGNSLNDNAILESSPRCQRIDDATSMVQQGYFKVKWI